MRPSLCAECNGHLDPYLPDCPHCGEPVPSGEFEHHDRDIQIRRDHPNARVEVERRWKLHVPWGLFIILGLYSTAAYFYVQYSDRTSPENQSAIHLQQAQDLLGPDEGETAKDEDLQKAYAHLVEALTLNTDDLWGHQQLERVSWELAKRGQKPPDELKRRADFLGAAWAQIQDGRKSSLPESPRERWDIDGVVDATVRLKRYLVFGGLVIVLLWAYKEFQEYKFTHKRDDEHEIIHREELRTLDSHRRR